MSVMPKQVDTFLDNPAGKWCSEGLDYLYNSTLKKPHILTVSPPDLLDS